MAIAASGPGTHQWKLLPTVKVRWPLEMGSGGIESAWAGATSSKRTRGTMVRESTVLAMVYPYDVGAGAGNSGSKALSDGIIVCRTMGWVVSANAMPPGKRRLQRGHEAIVDQEANPDADQDPPHHPADQEWPPIL